jgi:hypothetical protein
MWLPGRRTRENKWLDFREETKLSQGLQERLELTFYFCQEIGQIADLLTYD